MDTPCRVSIDLRQHQADQEHAGRLYDDAERRDAAIETIHDGELLKKLLEDEFLAPFIAEALAGLGQAGEEMAALAKNECPITKLVLQRLIRLERVLFSLAMERR